MITESEARRLLADAVVALRGNIPFCNLPVADQVASAIRAIQQASALPRRGDTPPQPYFWLGDGA